MLYTLTHIHKAKDSFSFQMEFLLFGEKKNGNDCYQLIELLLLLVIAATNGYKGKSKKRNIVMYYLIR